MQVKAFQDAVPAFVQHNLWKPSVRTASLQTKIQTQDLLNMKHYTGLLMDTICPYACYTFKFPNSEIHNLTSPAGCGQA